MRQEARPRAFTIVELMVVISIIALLIGLLLPAVAKARDSARVTQSQSNVRQIAQALQIYSSEYNNRQWTAVVDDLGTYQNGMAGFRAENGFQHPCTVIAKGAGAVIWYYCSEAALLPTTINAYPTGGGSMPTGMYLLTNIGAINSYMNQRFYDPVFWAPKDRGALSAVSQWFDYPGGFDSPTPGVKYPTYSISSAAMFHPGVFAPKPGNSLFSHSFEPPLLNGTPNLPGGYRSPAMGSARHSDQKTHVMEHHWLQNAQQDCHLFIPDPMYDGCRPYYFNAAAESTPMAAFYDGSVQGLSVQNAVHGHVRLWNQTEGDPGGQHGIWSRDVNLYGNGYRAGAVWLNWASYYTVIMDIQTDHGVPSFHTATTNGIWGRDRLAE